MGQCISKRLIPKRVMLTPECRPDPLLQALSRLEPATMKSEAWTATNVRRNGKELGTLFHNRQKYHRFEIEQKTWSEVLKKKEADE